VRDVPKPLLEVAGQPFALHQLRLLAAHGAHRVVLCVGYLGERIERMLGFQQFGLSLRYSYDGPGLDGTLGAVRRALPLLGERFLVLYGDTYLRLDYPAVADSWRASRLPGLMTVLRNDDRWDKSNVVFNNGLVERYDKRRRTSAMRWIDYGLGGLTADAIDCVGENERDLAILYSELARRRLLHGVEVSRRFYEIGTPQALSETDRFLRAQRTRHVTDD
jgi:NDP-sugar pyrophosphorylase family protein